MAEPEYTNIRIETETRDKLKALVVNMDDTYDTIINKLMEAYND